MGSVQAGEIPQVVQSGDGEPNKPKADKPKADKPKADKPKPALNIEKQVPKLKFVENDGDLEDPLEMNRKACGPLCQKFADELDACTVRVTDHSDTPETCEQELMDLMHCIDECAVHRRHLFRKLK